MTITEELVEQFSKLDVAQQQRILSYVRIVTHTPHLQGESGTDILKSGGMFDAQSLDEMEVAIQTGCEGINWL